MADPEHVKRLRQSRILWNDWRNENPAIQPDLSSADLCEIFLSETNLYQADLRLVKLNRTDLRRADLRYANLRGAEMHLTELRVADLRGADLRQADLRSADLRVADLRGANLNGADLSGADLSRAKLSEATLHATNLRGVRLDQTYLHGAIMDGTIIEKIDLRATNGLTEINHQGPSAVVLYTVLLPQDGSALHFLRGAGVPDEWIDDYRARMLRPIQYHSLFISYSSKDETLARRLHNDLQASGVRCWFAPEDLKIGDKFRSRIDEAIHLQDKLLLLLSEHSIASTWVENEVEAALEKEDRQQREVLFPVRLDNVVMQTSQAWTATLRRTRHIGDFTNCFF